MPRILKIRPELESTGIMLNNEGIEVARLTVNNILILNEQEVFLWLMQKAGERRSYVPATIIYIQFGLTGGWGRDNYVDALLRKFDELKLIYTTKAVDGTILSVMPRTLTKDMLKKFEPYKTRAEIFAELENIEK